tara:strand:+ start:3400 stop:3720 length:321 start_codon:yes stop_codon:yes gene_type:complete
MVRIELDNSSIILPEPHAVYSFIFINGIFDILMALSHKFFGWSWWSQYGVSDDYIYFALLYGFMRILQQNHGIVSLSYLIEALYFYLEKGATYTFLVCIFLSIIAC